ncbi:50S ribosomal protein L25 [Kallipyga massiliensis]|uniref:50S ribosomal protein L25 n=1 Tax=Kallipyga massiliensis TaxID=1472764 RepID=UPI0004B72BC3|nr:50S ribosomal protein L25 [Kallipyga massiliensis]
MAKYSLNVQSRDAIGSNRVNKLRNQGIIPAVVYHRGEETESVQVNEREFNKVFSKAGTSTLVDLNTEEGPMTVLIKEVQNHPVRGNIIHIDFQAVNMNEAINVTVPVILRGRDEIRVQPSVLLQFIDEISVTCLPGDIPQTAEADVENMQIGDTLTVADLDIAGNDKLTLEFELDEPLCSLNQPEEEVLPEEGEEEAEVSAADVPEIGDEDKEEGEEE